jgi:hypothetical protein
MAQQVLEADQQRRGQVHHPRLAHHVDDRDRDAFVLEGRDRHLAVGTGVEVSAAPPVDHVERRRILGRPIQLQLLRYDEILSGQFVSCASSDVEE